MLGVDARNTLEQIVELFVEMAIKARSLLLEVQLIAQIEARNIRYQVNALGHALSMTFLVHDAMAATDQAALVNIILALFFFLGLV